MQQDSPFLFNKLCNFMLGISNIKDIPNFNLPEIAFWGRSNVGKSSLINTLLGTKKMVKVSNTPGKTSEINFFNLGEQLIIADLPGYGFAKVSKTTKEEWLNLVLSYFRVRSSLKRIFLLIDAKVGIKDIDKEAMDSLDYLGRSYIIVLTKTDKLKEAELKLIQEKIAEATKRNSAAYPQIFVTSSVKKNGIKELQSNIINTTI